MTHHPGPSLWSLHGGHLLLLGLWALAFSGVWARAQHDAPPLPRRDPRVRLAAAAAALAAVVHLSVVREHLAESLLYGVFFLALTAAQLGWAAVVLRRATRPALVAGAVASALVALLWLVTRTVGIPLGPAAGEVEPVGADGVLATLAELVLAGAVTWALVAHRGRRTAAVAAEPEPAVATR